MLAVPAIAGTHLFLSYPCRMRATSRSTQHLVCMELHVFIFCIILSAVASGVVVASKSLFERLNSFINRSINGPDLDLKHRHASRSPMPRVPNPATQVQLTSSSSLCFGVLRVFNVMESSITTRVPVSNLNTVSYLRNGNASPHLRLIRNPELGCVYVGASRDQHLEQGARLVVL